jgi:tRNA-dihydrouridine synthase B
MRLGKLEFDKPLVLAPMAGITDYPFRKIAREMGCGLVFTEMISAEGLLRKKGAPLRIRTDEKPVVVQLSGSHPAALAEAARVAEAMGADGIDINLGCPVRKVVKTGAGAHLMRSPERVKRILTEVRSKLSIPLTIKIRSGWDNDHINAVEISRIAEDCGGDGISIHPRTKAQGFSGRADWSLIGEVKRAVRIPVVGNGDVTTSLLARRMMEETGCDGVMIGRGAFGNPWIFRSKESDFFPPSLEERFRLMEHHFSLLREEYGESWAVIGIRRHVAGYTRGLPCCTSFRSQLFQIKEKGRLLGSIQSYFDFVRRREECQSFNPMENRSATG